MKITFFRDVTLCNSVERYQRFILKTEALHGFEPLVYYRASRCHIPKQQSLNNCLTNFVPIALQERPHLPRRRQNIAASTSRRGAVRNTASPLDRSRWDPQAAPYRCNTWSTPDASRCLVLLATRTRIYHHSTVPPRTATQPADNVAICPSAKKRKGPFKSHWFSRKAHIQSQYARLGLTYTWSWAVSTMLGLSHRSDRHITDRNRNLEIHLFYRGVPLQREKRIK
jgi:hypothetical protein